MVCVDEAVMTATIAVAALPFYKSAWRLVLEYLEKPKRLH